MRKKQKELILQWMAVHDDFVKLMDKYAVEIAMGEWGNVDFDESVISGMLKNAGFTDVDFSPEDLLICWAGENNKDLI